MPTMEPSGMGVERCTQCSEIGGPLLACDEELNQLPYHKGLPKPRFCNNCMIGKKVKVFWPVDERWYVGVVMAYDRSSGEHELQYPDGDTEWVKIGDIISAAAGGSASANNSTMVTNPDHLGGPPGHHLQRPPGHAPMHHQEVSPAQGAPPPPGGHRLPPHHPDHHRIPTDDDGPDYRGAAGSGAGPVPPAYGYGGPSYPPGMGGAHYPPHSGAAHGGPPPGSGVPPAYSGAPGGPQPGGGGGPPPTQRHPNMPPPQMLAYAIYPPPPGVAGPYGNGPMFAPHHHPMPGATPYGMPPGAMGGMPQSYYQNMGGATSPSLVKDDDDDTHNGNDGGRSRKSGPKPWTKEEDTLLLNLVHTMQWPMKWTIVAQSLPDRTGKQCRERYVNHLNPRLKASDWNPVEDSTIFYLYNTIGSHWAKMSKIIPGRTDNGIKNRFHNIRRQYEREDSHRLRLSSVEDFPDEIRLDRLRKFPEHLEGKLTQLWDMKGAIGVLAAQSVLGGSNSNSAISRTGGNGISVARFGPFRKPAEGAIELCVRCGLLVPSVHTGMEICAKTGWCQSCTRLPPNVGGNLLRECLNFRRADNLELRRIIEAFEEFFVPDAENAWPYKKSGTTSREKKEEETKT